MKTHAWPSSIAAVLLVCTLAGADELPPGNVFRNALGMEFVRVEPGTFRMGRSMDPLPEAVVNRSGQRGGDFDEVPVREVTIGRPFFLGVTEVTNAQYEAFDPGHRRLRGKWGFSKEDDEAVVFVDWHEAVRFCEWLSRQEGLPYRLPTEAEWEYACRAGTVTPFSEGETLGPPWTERAGESWFPDTDHPSDVTVTSIRVKQTPPNPWGLFDMHGNVEEWCHDWYGPYDPDDLRDPVGRASGIARVTRGGSHSTEVYYLRSENRSAAIPEDKHWLIGFRVVLGAMPDTAPLPPPAPERHQQDVRQAVPEDIDAGPDPAVPYFQGPRKYVHIREDAFGPMFAKHNHVPALVECPNGDLLAAWYTCVREPGRELAAVATRLRYGREEWEPAAPFWDVPDRNDHATALWFDGDRTLYHFEGLSAAATWGNLAAVLRTSTDNGATWSYPSIIIPEHKTRHMPIESVIRLQDGQIALPCDAVTGGHGGSALWLSPDEGVTWYDAGGTITGIHAGVVELKDGRLLALGRGDTIDGRMPLSISSDRGATWTYRASPFPPIAGGQRLVLRRLREGPLFLASFANEPVTVTDAAGVARPVTGLFTAVSYDEGETWSVKRLVSDDGPGRPVETTDGAPFTMSWETAEPRGYLAMCQARNGVIHLVGSRQHYAFNLAWLETPPPAAPVAAAGPTADLSWPSFMAAHDPVWERLPQEWWEAPYLGNGLLGTLIRQVGPRTVEWQAGRSDVEDHRKIPYGMGRMPIGRFLLETAGDLTGCDMRLDLWNAEAVGVLRTTEGAIRFRCLVPAGQDAIVVSWQGEGGEGASGFAWKPQEAVHPRYAVHRETRPDFDLLKEWRPNPEGYADTVGDTPVWVQPLEEGAYATAWRQAEADGWRTLWASIDYAWPGDAQAVAAAAAEAVRAAAAVPMAELVAGHRDHWHRYYRQAFFSVSDPYWQSFYWNQIYKLGAATRPDGPILDLQGPWSQETPWPGAWWNLNVQLTYWPMYAGNRIELAQPLPRSLREQLPTLIANVEEEFQADSAGVYRSSTTRLEGGVFYPAKVGVPGRGEAEIGNLLWACHNVWLHYRMTGDDGLLRDTLFPVLRRAVNYHRHFLEEGEDGRLHLPETRSPEYKSGPDCNYDLALLRWGAATLLRIADRLGLDDPLAPAWRDIGQRLADYPEDERQGFLIARDVPMDSSHRHYSHLLMAYPLYLVNPEQPGGADRIRRSLDHWHSFPDALFGYSFTGGASMAAVLRDGNRALGYLEGFKSFVEPNTMYREAGPVIETPLSAAQSIHDMLIQSWDAPDGPLIRLFPAVPDAWADVVFHPWRAEGAFLVSAARAGGRTAWVRVESLAGEPCRIEARFTGAPVVLGPQGVAAEPLGDDRYRLPLERGQAITLVDPGWDGGVAVAPVPGSSPEKPLFGLAAEEPLP